MAYVVQDDTGRYSLTYKLCGIANNIKMHTSIRNICLPFMKEVSRYFGETVNLSEEENMSVVYLEVIQCERQALCTTQRIGKVAPLYCTGVGKLFMLNHPWEKLCDYYEKNKPVKYTENTCTTMEEIFNKMETARECGYSTDDEECEMGMRCVAVPIRNYTGEIIAGLSVSGPTTRMTLENIQEKVPYLLEISKKISRRLGAEI
jgi:DNA-binding IclR family transcriptional regulator